MQRIFRSVLTVSFILTGVASAIATEDASRAPTLSFEGGLWFDGSEFVADHWYAVEGRLTRKRPEEIDNTIDLAGRYAVPGLSEAHNHDLQNPAYASTASERYLKHGIYRSVQMCARSSAHVEHADSLGGIGAVDARFVDACISAPDGHPLGIALASMRQAGMDPEPDELRRQAFDALGSASEIDSFLQALGERGAELIKLILVQTERYEQTLADKNMYGFRGLEPAIAKAVVDRARAAGIRVAAHVETAGDFAFAVRIGVDLIAHLPGYRLWEGTRIDDYRIPEDIARRAARRNVAVITTAGAIAIAGGPEGPDTELLALQAKNLQTLSNEGVALVIGSDNPMGTVIDELVHLESHGVFSRPDLLRMATEQTAAIMFPESPYGVFEEGAEASFNVYDDDPLALGFNVLRVPVVRVQRGVILPASAEVTDYPGARSRTSFDVVGLRVPLFYNCCEY